MKTILLPKDQRGTANYGWLEANFSFSFNATTDYGN
jgi:hypothetical protein